MDIERLEKILPLMFSGVRVDEQAKANLKQRLFRSAELSDDELTSVAAAGDPVKLNRKTQLEKE